MRLTDLAKLKDFNLITSNINLDKDIKDIYASDLLSFVMGHVKQKDTLLLTVLNSTNVIAVASLIDINSVIFCEGVIPTQEVIKKSYENNIVVFSTNLSSAKSIKVIYESLL